MPMWLEITLAILGPIVVAVLGTILGFRVWQHQQVAKQRHDAALESIRRLIFLRQQFWYSRSPLSSDAEARKYAKDFDFDFPDHGLDPAERRRQINWLVYHGRFSQIAKEFTEARTVFHEIEALFGDEYREALSSVDELLREYRVAADMLTGQGVELDGARRREYHSVIYGHPTSLTDTYGQKFESRIDELINSMRAHLISLPRSLDQLLRVE